MNDLKRISWLAILLIVVLRISIGWQFLYEGMWKYGQMSGPNPWSAEGYLKNAQGPFRDHFREMTGDPDDLNWLDYEKMSRKWYAWRDKVIAHYGLNAEQQQLLNIMLDSSAEEDTAANELPPIPTYFRTLEVLPAQVDFKKEKVTDAIIYDAEKKRLIVKQPVTPGEEAKIKALIDVVPTGDKEMPYIKAPIEVPEGEQAPPPVPADEVEAKFYQVFDQLVNYSRTPIERKISSMSAESKKEGSEIDRKNFLYAASRISSTVKKSLPYRHRLAASILGDPERAGVYGALNSRGSFDIEMGTVVRSEEGAEKHNIRFGKIKEYKELLKEYETALKTANTEYQLDHAAMLAKKVAIMRADVTGPVRALEAEFKENALKILTAEQLAKGALPPDNTPLHKADMMAMWGLLILGTLLIFGFCTRFAALLGAIMVLNFYLVIPPWPGVPPAPGPEHSLYINKNMIEIIALLGIATLPTGSWFGLDAFFSHLFFGGGKGKARSDKKA